MNRAASIQQIQECPQWDIIIIGGGATGLGCAVDAAKRGYKTLLLEKHDFSKGSSSRATKLVHGGVRYLAQGNIRLVIEALRERGRLLKNAPHVCHTLAFVVPFYNNWQKFYYWCGLWLYDLLSGKLSIGSTKFLSKQQTLSQLPNLDGSKIAGGVLYFDGQFDDSRLAINLAQTAVNNGATVINYFSVTGFEKNNGKISGLMAVDMISGNKVALKSTVVINATGVFADEILQLAEGQVTHTIAPSQGIHLVVSSHLFNTKAALMVPHTDDGRVLFAIPWHDKLLLGTTDTAVDNISTEPTALKEEIDFVINHFNRYASGTISYSDVLSVFVGLRPLAKTGNAAKTAVMPRDHHVTILPSGLVHITGGKWTTYRSMAAHAIDSAIRSAGLAFVSCATQELPIHGFTTNSEPTYLSVYGSDAINIKSMMQQDASLKEKIHPHFPYTRAEVKWVVQYEMAITVEDVLARRLRMLFLDASAAIDAAPIVAEIMASELHKDEQWISQQVAAFNKLAQRYLVKFIVSSLLLGIINNINL